VVRRRLERAGPLLWAAAAGVTLALALPGPGLGPLVLLFPGLLLASIAGAGSWRSAALAGLVGGTVHWLVSVHWVLPVMHDYGRLPLLAAVACLVVMAGLLGLSWALVAGVVRLAPAPLRVVLLPFAWIAVEAWRQFPPYVFPWNPTAAALASSPALLSSAPVWGATGIGWAAVALGAGLAGVLRRPTRALGLATAAAAVVLTLAFSALAPAPEPAGPPLEVAVIQPGTGLEVKWDPARWQEMVAGVWRLTREAAAKGAKLVLWPESAVPFSLERDPAFRGSVVDLARELDVTIVLTSIGSTPSGGATNSAYAVSPAGVAPVRYDKVRLVPFGEYVPLVAHFAFTRALVREVGQFTPGKAPVLLPAGVPLGMSICYEVVFADLVATQVRIGATVLATLTNDAWYGFSSAPHQHFAQAVLRAAETSPASSTRMDGSRRSSAWAAPGCWWSPSSPAPVSRPVSAGATGGGSCRPSRPWRCSCSRGSATGRSEPQGPGADCARNPMPPASLLRQSPGAGVGRRVAGGGFGKRARERDRGRRWRDVLGPKSDARVQLRAAG